jgi:hypothetical protein
MIDRIAQWFEIGMLIDHRGAQISVTHNVANERWVLRLCHRVGAEGMPRVIEDDVLGNPAFIRALRNCPATVVRWFCAARLDGNTHSLPFDARRRRTS